MRGQDSGLTWDDALKSHVVVVLGEPGSGKSWELEERARSLAESGYFAFFVRLEQLSAQTLQSILDPTAQQRFRDWLGSAADATFFLDSVDEAKLRHPGDFFAALDSLIRAIGEDGLPRTRLVISSRISEWQPDTDKNEVAKRFASRPQKRRGDASARVADADGKPEAILVVELEPFDRRRVEQFVRARGVPSPEAFIAALDTAHAWEFARRPLDVVELLQFWVDRGRVGSLTELVEFSVDRKLRETAARERRDPLTPQRARAGAEALAAATVFCRQLTFRVPDQAFLALEGDEALDAANCLPADWLPAERRALLERAIFDGASYGRIRFHHRRVAEYLAAKWLEARVREGCPIDDIEELLCETSSANRVIRPALAPVTAWLSVIDDPLGREVRRWVLDAYPELYLQYGDPSRLSPEYKRAVLRRLGEKFAGRGRIWIESEPESLSRLAEPAIASDVAAIIADQSVPSELRAKLLLLVRHGRLDSCVDAALDIVASPYEPQALKTDAAAVVRDIGADAAIRRLAEVAASFSSIPNGLCGIFCEALYPGVIDANALVALLRKTDRVARFGVDLPYVLRRHLDAALRPEDCGELLVALVELGRIPPHVRFDAGAPPVSDQFSWVGSVLPTALRKLLAKSSLTTDERGAAAEALRLLCVLRHSRDRLEKLPDLNAASKRHAAVRQRCFWLLVQDWREQRQVPPEFVAQIFDYREVLQPELADTEWLIDDIATSREAADRELATRFATELWNHSGRPWRIRRNIRRAAAADHGSRAVFRVSEARGRWMRLKSYWYRYVRRTLGSKWWRRRVWLTVQRWYTYLRDQWVLLRYIQLLSSGEPTQLLAQLAYEAHGEGGEAKWTPTSWMPLRRKRGSLIARAARNGCKRAWHRFVPLLPHEKPDPQRTDQRVIVGLAGLQAAVTDGELDFASVDVESARLAARYGVNELNGFASWFRDLAANQPEAVRDILCECVRAEWQFAADRQHVNEVLNDLVWHGEGLIGYVKPTLLDLLRKGDPQNSTILRHALTIMVKDEQCVAELGPIALDRLQSSAPMSATFQLWLTVLMEVDGEAALSLLENALVEAPSADELMVRICAALGGSPSRFERLPSLPRPDYLNPTHLRRLIPIVFRHVRLAADVNHIGEGGYSPDERYAAQDFRNGLLTRLAAIGTPQARQVLIELRDERVLADARDWISHLIDQVTERAADLPPWTAADVQTFAADHEVDPKTDRDLFRIACKRLRDIKREVEKADISSREQVRHGDGEEFLRRWLALKLRERARGRYTVPQEEEIDRRKRPDLRIEHPKTAPVSIEVKWAERWTLSELLERLENQLVGQYLRAHDSRHGVYFLGMVQPQHRWRDPTTGGNLLSFQEVVEIVRSRARELEAARADVDAVEVVSVDFR